MLFRLKTVRSKCDMTNSQCTREGTIKNNKKLTTHLAFKISFFSASKSCFCSRDCKYLMSKCSFILSQCSTTHPEWKSVASRWAQSEHIFTFLSPPLAILCCFFSNFPVICSMCAATSLLTLYVYGFVKNENHDFNTFHSTEMLREYFFDVKSSFDAVCTVNAMSLLTYVEELWLYVHNNWRIYFV